MRKGGEEREKVSEREKEWERKRKKRERERREERRKEGEIVRVKCSGLGPQKPTYSFLLWGLSCLEPAYESPSSIPQQTYGMLPGYTLHSLGAELNHLCPLHPPAQGVSRTQNSWYQGSLGAVEKR